MPALTLVSVDACPFVQRAAILLQEQRRDDDAGRRRLLPANDEDAARALVGEIRGHFEDLAGQLPSEGPLWGGETYTMVDAAIAPILQRLTWAEALEPTLGLFEGLPRIAVWRDALLTRPSTNAAIVPDLEQRSGRMLQQIGSWVARDFAPAPA